MAFHLQPLICRRGVFWGFGFGLMNPEFSTENWLLKPLGKAHVRWASPGCGVEAAFVRYGLLPSRAG